MLQRPLLAHDLRAFWFLGPATYVRHLPGDVFNSYAAAVS